MPTRPWSEIKALKAQRDREAAEAVEPAGPTQPTQPQGADADGQPYEPVEIPVPLKRDVLRDLAKGATPEPPADPADS